MAVGRFAGKALKNAFIPRGAFNVATEVLPDILGATFAAASIDADPGRRAGVFLEDLLLGVGGSFGGRALGALGGLATHGRVRGPRSLRTALESAERGAGIGGMVGGYGAAMLGPRPFLDRLRAEEMERMSAEQRAREQAIYEQGLLASTLAGSPRVQGIDQLLGAWG